MLFELTGFQRDLLYVISGLEKPSGQAIKDRFERDFSAEINAGRLYPNLDVLVDGGYVEKGQRDRRTNFYQLTTLGHQQLVDRRQWETTLLDGSINTLS